MNQIATIVSVAAESLVQEKVAQVTALGVIASGVIGEKMNESIQSRILPDWITFGDITMLIGSTVGILTIINLYKKNKLLDRELSKEDRRQEQKPQE
jgi:hypothetical protein